MPKTYTVKEVAKILGFSTNSIYTFLRENRLKGVRVGKGRFRISQEEVDRILQIHTNEASQAPVASNQDAPTVLEPAPLHLQVISPPNLFDWFLGMAAIIAGMALFLFNSMFGAKEFSRVSSLLLPMRLILIAGGVGVLVSSFLSNSGPWRKIFYIVLAVTGMVSSTFLFRAGDFMGASIYGLLSLVGLLVVLLHIESIVSLGLYLSLVALSIPIGIYLYPNDPNYITRTLSVWFRVGYLGNNPITRYLPIFFRTRLEGENVLDIHLSPKTKL